MKRIFASLALTTALMATLTATAQNAYESSIKFEKTNETAVVADFDRPEEVVKAALKERLDKDGLSKMKSSKGFMTYKGAVWTAVSADKLDIYFKVEGRKGKSTISVLVSRGYNNFITSGTDQRVIDNVKTFLNSMQSYADAYQNALDAKAQEEAMKKAEKAKKEAEDDKKDLMAEQEKLQKKIEKNNKEQQAKQKALDEKVKNLNNLKSQN